MKTLKATRFMRIAEQVGFSVSKPCYEPSQHHDDFCIEMQMFTPAGEDWWTSFFVSNAKEIPSKIKEIIDDWDSDEEAEVWINIRGTRGVPSSVRVILDDQDWKLEELKELYYRLIND